MKKRGRQYKFPEWIAVLLITIIGALIRSYFVLQKDYPLNDGGMFYTMIRDLQVAGFHLPAVTTYNNAQIPFAYPPLGFYIAGVLNSWFHIDLIQLLRFVPLFFSILTIPAFYWLANQLLDEKVQRIIVTGVFAVLPSAYTWQIMGGGLTRSIAYFLTILALANILKWVRTKTWVDFIGVILFTSLTALSHLEMLWMLLISYIVIFIFRARSWKHLLHFCFICLSVVFLTSPWWGTVIAQHGLKVFFNAFGSGNFSILVPLATLLYLTPNVNIVEVMISFLAIIGALFEFRKRRWFLPAWWLFFILFDPRSSLRSMVIPMALLAGIALDVALKWIGSFEYTRTHPVNQNVTDQNSLANPWVSTSILLALFFAIFNNLFMMYSSGIRYFDTLNLENRIAMKWISENTPTNSRFLVLDFPSAWSTDSVGEWFPTLSLRTSILTAQGKEWLPNNEQGVLIGALSNVSKCGSLGVLCLEEWVNNNAMKYDFIYFTNNSQDKNWSSRFTSLLQYQISMDPDFVLIYSNDDVQIYKYK